MIKNQFKHFKFERKVKTNDDPLRSVFIISNDQEFPGLRILETQDNDIKQLPWRRHDLQIQIQLRFPLHYLCFLRDNPFSEFR